MKFGKRQGELEIKEAVQIMEEHNCGMSEPALRAWCRSVNSPCPFGTYTQEDENNSRGKYTIFEGRLMFWLTCSDMRIAYGGNYVDTNSNAQMVSGL